MGPLYQLALFVIVLYFLYEGLSQRQVGLAAHEIPLLLFVASGFIAFWKSGADVPIMGRVMLHHLALLAWIPLSRSVQNLGAQRPAALKLWIRWVVFLGGIIGVVSLTRFFLSGATRASGLYNSYFFLGAQMVFILPLGVSVLVTASRKVAWATLVAMGPAVGALCFSYTRSAILGLFLASVLWLVAMRREWALGTPRAAFVKNMTLVALPLALLVGFVLNTSDPRFSTKISRLATAKDSPKVAVDLFSGRGIIISDGLKILRQNWEDRQFMELLLGEGLDSRQRLVGGKFTSWESDYLQVLLDQGAVGLGLLLWIWGMVFWQIIQAIWNRGQNCGPEDVGLAVGLAGLLLMTPLTLVMTSWLNVGFVVIGSSWLRKT